MKHILISLIALFLFSCNNDVYETYSKEREFTIRKIKRSGKRHMRGFYVEGSDYKIRYRDILNGKYEVGDKVVLKYDSIVNKTKGTYELKTQRRITD
jgi:PBP1b-binding outer membrane lipoprotein LpoB